VLSFLASAAAVAKALHQRLRPISNPVGSKKPKALEELLLALGPISEREPPGPAVGALTSDTVTDCLPVVFP